MIDKLAALFCFIAISLSVFVEAGSFFHGTAQLGVGHGSPTSNSDDATGPPGSR